MNLTLFISFVVCLVNFGSTQLISIDLLRGYHLDSYCLEHSPKQKIPKEFLKYLDQIPADSHRTCDTVYCTICENIVDHFHEYYCDIHRCDSYDEDEYGDDQLCIYLCDCKRRRMEELAAQYDYFSQEYENFHAEGRMDSWKRCSTKGIYVGYYENVKYRTYALDYLDSIHGSSCNCYWPELSEYAAKINNKAYNLFMDLFSTTALKALVKNLEEQKKFFQCPAINLHGTASRKSLKSYGADAP